MKKVTVKKGKHYSDNSILRRPSNNGVLKQTISFDENCWYGREVVTNTGWNKLTGIAALLPSVRNWSDIKLLFQRKFNPCHIRSSRFVYQPDFANEGYMRLAAYAYGADKDRYAIAKAGWTALEFKTKVKTGDEFNIEVSAHTNGWSHRLYYKGEVEIIIIYGVIPKTFYRCTLYFGGRDKAYHDMSVNYSE